MKAGDVIACSVLSGNRNFEGRVHAEVRMNFLASPPLVVAYALAGTLDIDLVTEPVGVDSKGQPVFLKDIWPSAKEVQETVLRAIDSKMFRDSYATVFKGDENWSSIKIPQGNVYAWEKGSTYVKNPPYFDGMTMTPAKVADVHGARALAVLGDSVTTDHISPRRQHRQVQSGRPLPRRTGGAAGGLQFLRRPARQSRSHDARHLRQYPPAQSAGPGTEGGVTVHLPSGEQMPIYDAAMRYKAEGTPLVILAGREYGTGSSRDWAAKGTMLLGARAVIAESFERIHRSNLIGMGVLPLQFLPGQKRSRPGSHRHGEL